MSAIPKGSTKELVEEGPHNAVCVKVIDLGTQPNSNPEWPAKRKVMVMFELPDIAGDYPTLLSKQYTFSDSTKGNLFADLKAWLGVKNASGFDMDTLLGKAALLTVEHKETDKGTFANISNLSALPKGSNVHRPATDLVSLFLDETFDHEIYENLPDWIKVKIASSDEGKASLAEHAPAPAKGKGGKTTPAPAAKKGRR